ncbi:MAG: LysM peptidoglycan-binding domain-containing protein [Phycisphaera sp.]|nr:LysM peptidoglycan-binding domain-containing protein [Phycisphaera sp.]
MRRIPRKENRTSRRPRLTARRVRLCTFNIPVPALAIAITLAASVSVWALPLGVASPDFSAVSPDANDLTRRVLEARARQLLQSDEVNPAELIRERIERVKAAHPPVPDVVLPPPHELVPPPAPEPAAPADAQQLFNTAPAHDASQAETFNPVPHPAAPTTRSYEVQKGDTLGAIAEKQLGTVKHLPDILKLNPGLDPRKLRVGQSITLPILGDTPAPADTLGALKPHSAIVTPPAAAKPAPAAPLKTTTVEKGETLGHISQRVYGTVRYWKNILDANHDTLKDPKHLRVGMTLKIPPKPE